MTGSVLLRGGHVVDGSGAGPVRSDVAVRDGVIAAVGPDAAEQGAPGSLLIDCADRLVMPGFVDVHSHADAAVFSERVQRALLRQGITAVVAGQDGVSYAPGDGGYASEYFGGLNGPHPAYRGGGVSEMLAGYDGTSPINVAYLVPAGTVRYEVMGRTDRPAERGELEAMRALVADGLAAGAVGMSTGLDYVPGGFAATEELAALAEPLAGARAVYVSHMRGGYEANLAAGIAEVVAICRSAGRIAGHVSHLHAPPDLALAVLADAAATGADLTFDAYPYRAGCTLVSMPLLPPALLMLDPAEVLAQLDGAQLAERVERDWISQVERMPTMGPGWADRFTIADAGCPDYVWAAGMSLAAAAEHAGQSTAAFAIALLRASRLQATAVMPLPPGRSVDDLAALIRHPAHMAGSDGVYLGKHPHPRGWGTMARLLARHVSARGDLSWGAAAWHLAGHPAHRFALPHRGIARPGYIADLAVVDPGRIADRATYSQPTCTAVGIDDVIVAGRPVLRDGALTGDLPGTGLRRANTQLVN